MYLLFDIVNTNTVAKGLPRAKPPKVENKENSTKLAWQDCRLFSPQTRSFVIRLRNDCLGVESGLWRDIKPEVSRLNVSDGNGPQTLTGSRRSHIPMGTPTKPPRGDRAV